MKTILRIIAILAVTLGHVAALYYFYSASWVTLSDFLIFWASLILVGLSMSLLFYIGLIIKIPTSGSYYQFAAMEKGGKLYEILGINSYKFILFHSPFVLLSRINYPTYPSRRKIGIFDYHFFIFSLKSRFYFVQDIRCYILLSNFL